MTFARTRGIGHDRCGSGTPFADGFARRKEKTVGDGVANLSRRNSDVAASRQSAANCAGIQMAACCRKLLRRRGAHAPRVPFPAPSLETSGDVFDGASNTTAVGGCAPYSKTGGRDAGANGTDWSRTPHSAFRIPHGQRTLFLNSVWDGQQGKSGGERARSPNASRGAEMPDGRASVWIAVALARLSQIWSGENDFLRE